MKSTNKDSTIVAHARRELERAGAFSKVDMEVSVIGKGTLALVKQFDSWCKGDQNKMKAISDAFTLLINGALLSPPTTDPSEWEVIDPKTPEKSWRSTRSPFYVSTDAGKTWTHIPSGTKGNSVNVEESHEEGKEEKESSELHDDDTKKVASVDTKVADKQDSSPSGDFRTPNSGQQLNPRMDPQGAENTKGSKSSASEPKVRKTT